jgi:hypothetical protein
MIVFEVVKPPFLSEYSASQLLVFCDTLFDPHPQAAKHDRD